MWSWKKTTFKLIDNINISETKISLGLCSYNYLLFYQIVKNLACKLIMQLHTDALLTVVSTVTKGTDAHVGRSTGYACSPVQTRLGCAVAGAWDNCIHTVSVKTEVFFYQVTTCFTTCT